MVIYHSLLQEFGRQSISIIFTHYNTLCVNAIMFYTTYNNILHILLLSILVGERFM